jgi:hypothetical protein
MTRADQIQKDILYCIEKFGLNDEQIGKFIRASEQIGVSCQYLAEEFVFESNTLEEFERLHLDPEYLKIKWRLDT